MDNFDATSLNDCVIKLFITINDSSLNILRSI